MTANPPDKSGTPASAPPAPGREKVRIRWALGGPIVDGEFDPATQLVHCRRGNKNVRISIHAGIIHWLEDPV